MDHEMPVTVPTTLGRLRVALEEAYARASCELGLTSQQAELLCAAIRPAAVGELATALRCDRSNVSRLVDRAASRGLIERTTADEDGRVRLVRLTKEGDELARRFIGLLERQLEPLLARWSAQQQHTAMSLMSEISDVLQAGEGSGARRRPSPRRRPAG